jgi:dienelactone hydrolase
MRAGLAIAALLLAPASAGAQGGAWSDPVQPAGPIGAAAGTGAWPAIAEARGDAPGYTIYRPQVLPRTPLPLVLWGNGGCRDNGLSASHFLREIASHGYIVIANGSPRREQTVERSASESAAAAAGAPPLPPPPSGPDETSVTQLLAAIDWAQAANVRRGDALFRRMDLQRIAVMGHSCGGLQALAAGADPRIETVMALASGVYNRAGSGLSRVTITKGDLERLHTPVAYILGGPTDIAYPNGMDDVARINHVPVFAANLPVGHGGTFRLANGGDWARVAVAWLDWQLKRDRAARAWFVGEDCRLCTTFGWTVQRKQFSQVP